VKLTKFILVVICFAAHSFAQNIIEDADSGKTALPNSFSLEQLGMVLRRTPDFGGTLRGAEAERIRAKLEKHVSEMLDGTPWKPFHHTLGISGYETYFDHPDEMFYALAIALPQLKGDTAARTRKFLAAQLGSHPPYALEGFDRRTGRDRESYQVPANLRRSGAGDARSLFGVYAFWAYCFHTGDTNAAKSHWTAVQKRILPVLERDYSFDIRKRNYAKDEAEILNGDIAGLIGFVRLARLNDDAATEQRAHERLRQMFELRLNLDRVNPHILEKTSASKNLHAGKLTRYCALMPEVGECLREWTDGCAAAHLRAFREPRNGWFIAFGDRMIGGENYTNPLHFPRALFAGATFIEQLQDAQLLSFVDVPWCKADFYFIEKCVFALWANSGRAWIDAD
jgi:hypothetical protein